MGILLFAALHCLIIVTQVMAGSVIMLFTIDVAGRTCQFQAVTTGRGDKNFISVLLSPMQGVISYMQGDVE